MTRGYKILIVVLVAALGIWGCNQGSAGNNAGWEKVKSLEADNGRLKDEAKAAEDARNQLRKKLGETEAERARLRKAVEENDAVARERDELKQTVTQRTTERDAATGQLEQLRKGIRGLLIQVDAALPPASQPVTSVPVAAPATGS